MKDLNFFSIYQGSIKERKDDNIYIYIAAAVVAAIILLTSGVYVVKLFVIGNSIQNYTNMLEADEIQTKLIEAETINNKLSLLNEYDGSLSNVIKSIKNADLIDNEFLIDIAAAVPSKITFKKWKMQGYELTMEGYAASNTDVAELEHNLRILPQFKMVHVQEIKVGETTADPLTFKMYCILKEVE